MRKFRSLLTLSAILCAMLPSIAHSDAVSQVRAGVGIADATWHVGTGSGQYAAKDPNAAEMAQGNETDPFFHGQTQQHSYGVQSRLTYRALVVEGANGKKIALVKSDSYLAQDMLSRRAAQILQADGSDISYDQIMLSASHNHSSPYYMSPSWGVWLFQDMFDIRTFEYHARAMAHAIEQADANLVPVRMGAATIRDTIVKGMIAHASITDDGTPGGYPESVHTCNPNDPNPVTSCHSTVGWGDFDDSVVRFDDITDPEHPKPLAVWFNHGQHPESNDGYALITADYLAPLERDIARDLGATLIFSQADVGSSEGPYLCEYGPSNDRHLCNERLSDGEIRAWAHVGHAQTERGARLLADLVEEAFAKIGGDDDASNAAVLKVPFSTDFPVDYLNYFVADPLSHPYPSVGNCRTETTAQTDPGVPAAGLPDCQRASDVAGPVLPDEGEMIWSELKAQGFPVPENYDAPSHGAVEENLRIHLQTFRMGEVLLESCSCEAQVDIIKNVESRTDKIQGNIVDGYDWLKNPDGSSRCTDNGNDTSTCTFPELGTHTYPNAKLAHMEAQIHNDAKGWDLPENAVAANSEPADVSKIWGNFTKEELPANLGYALPIGMGHTGDYDGYTVSYREYMSRDHYRKALTCCGAHTADYMATRLERMAGYLNGGPPVALELNDPEAQADEVRQSTEAAALGALSERVYNAWTSSLPNDKGEAVGVVQPKDITRFDAATFTWQGGNNAVDNPTARVERLVAGRWIPFADQSGEVQTMVRFPKGPDGVASVYASNFDWRWTANFEAFDAFPRTVVRGGQTPEGTYRFVVDGLIRHTGENVPYHIASAPFHVGQFQGLTVTDVQTGGGDVSFANSVDYPRTYTSPFRFIHDDGDKFLCKTCTFRPWATSGAIDAATVTVTRANGDVDRIDATLHDGRWVATLNLQPGDSATIAAGDLRDEFGETNGAPITLA